MFAIIQFPTSNLPRRMKGASAAEERKLAVDISFEDSFVVFRRFRFYLPLERQQHQLFHLIPKCAKMYILAFCLLPCADLRKMLSRDAIFIILCRASGLLLKQGTTKAKKLKAAKLESLISQTKFECPNTTWHPSPANNCMIP